MPVALQFGDYEFVATPIGFMPVSGFATSVSFEVDEKRKASGRPGAKKGGYGLIPVAFSVELIAALGIDPHAEFEELKRLCKTGTPRPLYMNGVSIEKYMFLLTSVSADETQFALDGEITRMSVSLEFTEFTKKVSAKEMKAQYKRSV